MRGGLNLPVFVLLAYLGALPSASAGFEPPQGWRQSGDHSGVTLWTLSESDERKRSLVVAEEAGIKKTQPPASDDALVKELRDAHWIANTLAGIRKWQVESVRREKRDGGTVVKLRGTYIDSEGQRVVFEEWKYFLPQGYAQITYAEVPGEAQPTSMSEVETLLRAFTPFKKAATRPAGQSG